MNLFRLYIRAVLTVGAMAVFLQVKAQPATDDALQQRLDSLKQQSQVDTALVQTYFDLAHYYLRQDSAKTSYYANRAFEVADSIDSELGRSIGNMALGLHHIIQGNYTLGLKHSYVAESAFEAHQEDEYLAMLYSYIGIGYSRLGNNNEALRYFLQSDSLMKIAGNPMQQAQMKANIGVIYSNQGHHRSTIKYFGDAMKIIEQFGTPLHLALGYHNIGVAYRHLAEYDSARYYLEKALELRKNSNDRFGLASTYHNMGTLYLNLGQFEYALSHLEKAIALQDELGDQGNLTDAYLDVARVYRSLNKPDEAKKFAGYSLEIAQNIGDLSSQAAGTLFLSELEEEQEHYQQALSYLKTHRELKDSLVAQNESQAFEEMRARYQTQEMEQQIELLQKEQKLRDAELSRTRLFRNSLIGGSGALLVILGLLFMRYRAGKEHTALLQAKNKKLRELSEEKSEYLNIAAHDLKTPLSSIMGLSELIKSSEKATDEIKEHAEFIHISSFRMLELIKQFLDVNAIESGKKLAEIKPVNLKPIVRQVVDNYKYRAEWKNISIKTQLPDEPLTALADESGFQEVMENLLSNAVKYSPKEKQVWIRAKKLDHNLHIEIEDEGPGLSAEEQQQLFQKFKRLGPNPTEGEGSTGLGLYIVKKMTNAMNGKVWCESSPGEGSTFIVELPLAEKGKS